MITLITGPMFSGKTTEMIRYLTRAKIAGKNVILLRPIADVRDFLTHDGREIEIKEVFVERIIGSFSDINEYDVIGVDEVQFFQYPDVAKHIDILANRGKDLYIAGLNGTSEKTPFDAVQQLIPLSENIIKLNAICIECGSDHGAFTYYTEGKKTESVKVGGKESYTALCRECYQKHFRDNEE